MKNKWMSEDESAVYFWAFRYCLGRMTYAVNWYCETATAKIRSILTHDLELMAREISEAEEHDSDPEKCKYHHALGMDCDKRDWLKLRDAILDELRRREEEHAEKKTRRKTAK